MSIYVMSDIHGESDLFHAMLEQIDFSESDTLYILGDVIDRGPDGIALLQEIRKTPNMVMLMGSHEYMMLRHYEPKRAELDLWNSNRYGNKHTALDFRSLCDKDQLDIIDYLKHLPSHILINVEGISYYLVHGFPGETMENEVRFRPRLHELNPVENTRLIIGHTPVLNLMVPKEEQQEFINLLARRGERPRILFAKGFIDIDCGCSYAEPMKTLGCLRLNDIAEYYTYHKQNIIDLTYDVKKSAV